MKVDPQHGKVVEGPLVLIPRVGRPDRRKIIAHHAKEPLVLSDCIFALTLESMSEARRVRKYVIDNFDKLCAMYGGSGAPFITKSKLALFIGQAT